MPEYYPISSDAHNGKLVHYIQQFREGAGLGRRLGPHDLRHTVASQLIAAGKSPVYVQRQMGHASVSTTVDLYGSGLPLEDRAGVDALDAPATTATTTARGKA